MNTNTIYRLSTTEMTTLQNVLGTHDLEVKFDQEAGTISFRVSAMDLPATIVNLTTNDRTLADELVGRLFYVGRSSFSTLEYKITCLSW